MSNQIADLNKVVESKTEYLEFESVQKELRFIINRNE